jgi:uncharacterized delta-60 repeat protein
MSRERSTANDLRQAARRVRRLRLEVLEDRRLLAAGALDPTFGFNGSVHADWLGRDNFIADLALQPDGKIVVAGWTEGVAGNALDDKAGNVDFLVARFLPSGALDRSFGSGGVTTLDFYGGQDVATSVVIQSDGKIVLGGWAHIGADDDFALARFDKNGIFDTSFGKVIEHFGWGDDRVGDLALQSDNRIVAAGLATTPELFFSHTDFGIVGFSRDGVRQSKRVVDFDLGDDEANAVDIGPDGEIVVAGRVAIDGNLNVGVVRLNSDHTFDDDFGKVNFDFHGGVDQALDVRLSRAARSWWRARRPTEEFCTWPRRA